MFKHPPTVTFWEAIRKYGERGQLKLGQGQNYYPAFPGLASALQQTIGHVFAARRIEKYGIYPNDVEFGLLADLLNEYFGCGVVQPEDLVVTNGATEAISLLCEHAVCEGWGALLPLPAYFCYELSAARTKLPICGYYNHGGHTARTPEPSRPVIYFANSPNAISGAFSPWADVRATGVASGLDVAFTVYDLVYQLQDFDSQDGSRRLATDVLTRCNLETEAILLTTSKDLSVPGMRAGLLITKNKQVLATARQSTWERYFAINPMCVYMCILYVAALLLRRRSASREERSSTICLVQKKLEAAGVHLSLRRVLEPRPAALAQPGHGGGGGAGPEHQPDCEVESQSDLHVQRHGRGVGRALSRRGSSPAQRVPEPSRARQSDGGPADRLAGGGSR
jgi:histidinol-phosphate/aromatic aminotransferase/cobyric acid decarboxylase-like protein